MLLLRDFKNIRMKLIFSLGVNVSHIKEEVIFQYHNFLHRKKIVMEKLKKSLEKGEVDSAIIPHLELINSLPFAYTTSSCAGRIILIDAPLHGAKHISKKVRVWHDTVEFNEVWDVIVNYQPMNILWLKFESFIISFNVASIKWATFFIKLARVLDLKESGIRSIAPESGYIVMDFMSTEKMCLPVALKNEIFVEKNYLEKVINIANLLMVRNKIRLDMLKESLEFIKHWILVENRKDPPPIKLFEPMVRKYKLRIRELVIEHLN